MEKSRITFYGDGEIWIDGEKRAKLYPDGDIWADGKCVASIYEDGEIWSNGAKIGRVFSDGELWINNKRVATGVHLLDRLEKDSTQESTSQYVEKQSFSGSVKGYGAVRSGRSGISLGGGLAFVVVLLIIAFLYACFRFWISEIPALLFGNMQNLGTAAMIFVYAGVFIMMYLHISMAIRKKKVLFILGMLLQAGTFFVNIIVFTILDLIVTALSYGYTVGDALGEIGGVLGGSFFGFLVIGIFVGLAPTIVSSLIGFICNKKGKIIPMPSGINLKPSRKSMNNAFHFGAVSKPSVSRRSVKYSGWDGERIIKALCCGVFLAMFVFLCAAMQLFITYQDVDALELGMLAAPAAAVVVGIVIRRKYRNRFQRPFVFGWLVHSALQFLACIVSLCSSYGMDCLLYIPLPAVCIINLIVGLFIAFFSTVFVRG